MNFSPSIFIFQDHQSRFPSAVFSTFAHAQTWIEQHQLEGILTEYPINYPIYGRAIDHEYFKVKKNMINPPNLLLDLI